MPEAVVPDPDKKETDWKLEFERVDGILRATQAKNHQFEDELKKLRTAEADRAASEASAKEDQERTKLAEQGKYQEALKNREDTLTAKHKAEVDSLHAAVNAEFLPALIKTAAMKVPNIVKEAIDDIPNQLFGKIKFDSKSMKPFVVGDDGQPMKDEKLAPVPIDSFVEKYVKSRSWLMVDEMAKGTGMAPGSGAATGKTYTVEEAINNPKMRAEWEKENPAEFKAAFEAHNAALTRPKKK